ncbi:MAG: globin domain-containing protein [Polyangiales bacterium]
MTILADSLKSILEREPHLPARFYDVLFRLHPSLSAMFGDRKRQETMLARMLVAIVDRYEDKPWIEEQVAGLGQRHKRLNLTPEMYTSFNTALLVTLEEAAGEELWTPQIERAWTDALADIARAMQSV